MHRRTPAWFSLALAAALGFSSRAPAEEVQGQKDQPAPPPARREVPPTAPFTPPSAEKPLPPPAPAPELGLPPATEPGAGIEERFRLFQATETVTTAGKREQSLIDVPLTLSVIPAEELEGTGQFTLCDAIQYFPGLECRRGAMRKAAVSARGLGSNFLSNRMLLLNDGRPETDPWTGQFYADETTPVTNLRQIEVIRGPGSALYGSNAFSGVINLIQRRPDDVIAEGRSYGTDMRVLGGEYNTFRLQATAAGKQGPVRALVNYYGSTTDGPALLSDPKAGIVDNNEGATTQQVSGRLEAKSLSLDVGYTNAEQGRPGGLEISAVSNCGRCHYTGRDRENVESFYGKATIDQKVSDLVRVFVDGYANFKRREVLLENQVTHEMQSTLGKRRRIGAEARALLSVQKLTVTIGGDVKVDAVNNQNILPNLTRDDTVENIYGAFVDAELRPTSQLILGAGVRYDAYDMPATVWKNQSAQVSPRASLVFHATPAVTLRGDYGRAFRAPTLAELAISQEMYASTLLGNPYLQAETLDTVEAAIDVWPLRDVLRLTGTGFYNRAANFINQVFLGGSTSQFENIGDAQVVGFEVEAAAQVAGWKAAFDVAYQFLDARAQPPMGPSTALDYAPQSRVYFRAHKRFGFGVFADFYGLYVGERTDPGFNYDAMGNPTTHILLPAYVVANARVGAEVYRRLTVSLLATNLFNTKYQETYGFPAPGLSVFSEVKLVY